MTDAKQAAAMLRECAEQLFYAAELLDLDGLTQADIVEALRVLREAGDKKSVALDAIPRLELN